MLPGILEALLWASLGMLFYIYAGYPALVMLLGRLFPRTVAAGKSLPSMTVIIAAYNEEMHIAATLRGILAQDYPIERLDIIVASDASNDRTDDIVRNFGAPNVRLLRIDGRLGKTSCQNAAAEAASGELLVFVDATTRMHAGALRAIARNFDDTAVGCVAGRLVYRARDADATAKGGVSYWGYETALRVAESRLGSLIGVSGCLYAVRRAAYRPLPPSLTSDFVIAMSMREQDLRTVLEPDAVCFEDTLDRADKELSMRVRVILQSLDALASKRHLLNPLRYGVFAWQLWSHKLLRYLSPVFLATAVLINLGLALHGEYAWLLAMQLAAIASGLVGFLPARSLGRVRLLTQAYYFLLTNLASAIGLFRFVRGERIVTWTPLR